MVWFHHVPSVVSRFFDELTWHGSRDAQNIHLTFDDGPVQGVTEFVLEQLRKRSMKATFFMVGDNVRKNPDLAKMVAENGHSIGNHTYHHVDGWTTSHKDYLKEIENCQEEIIRATGFEPLLFRPPYGRVTPKQLQYITPNFQVVMWDVISGDYDSSQPFQKCLEKTKAYIQNGSIVLFHDQKKTEQTLKTVLPDFLDFVEEKGYETTLL
jgi:peptidoglycan/xylan/chitin deacetylase (PgdA/CDA1 family)